MVSPEWRKAALLLDGTPRNQGCRWFLTSGFISLVGTFSWLLEAPRYVGDL